MGLALPKLDKPGDILSLLANPTKYSEYAERLIFLREEAEAKLADLSTKQKVEQYVNDKQRDINALYEAAAKDRHAASVERQSIQHDRQVLNEQLEVFDKVKLGITAAQDDVATRAKDLDDKQNVLDVDRATFEAERNRLTTALQTRNERVSNIETQLRQLIDSTQSQLKAIH